MIRKDMSIVEQAREGWQYEAEEAEHQLRAAFEAMREALEFLLAVHEGEPRGLMPAAKGKARAALALADATRPEPKGGA